MVDFAPLRRLRVQQVQPFTYRDGITFLELLERLATHVKDVLEPSLKNVVDDLVDQFTAEMGEHRDTYIAGVEEFQRIHDAFMADVEGNVREIHEGAVTSMVSDSTGQLGTVLRNIFAQKTEVTGLISDKSTQDRAYTDTKIGEFSDSVATSLGEVRQTITDNKSAVDASISSLSATSAETVSDLSALTLAVSTNQSQTDTRFTQERQTSDKKYRWDDTPYFYGAVGDGVADDTSALQAWLDAGAKNFASGTYRITAAITANRDNVEVMGQGAVKIIIDGGEHEFLNIRGDYAHVGNIEVDGNFKGDGGVFVYGSRATVENMYIHDLVNATNAQGIRIEGVGGSQVSNNIIENLEARGDDIGGNGVGMARGISIYNNGAAEHPNFITNNTLIGIWGEEGDAVTVLNSSPTVYLSGMTTVANNVFDGASRRFIKIQSSDAHVSGNYITDTFNKTLTNTSNCINVIDSSRVTIDNNYVNNVKLNSGIFFTTSHGASHGTISNNTIISKNTTNAIFCTGYPDVAITGNVVEISRGRAITISGNNAVIANNIARGATITETPAPRTFVITESSNYGVMANNVDNSAPSRYYAFENGSPNGITENNIKRSAT